MSSWLSADAADAEDGVVGASSPTDFATLLFGDDMMANKGYEYGAAGATAPSGGSGNSSTSGSSMTGGGGLSSALYGTGMGGSLEVPQAYGFAAGMANNGDSTAPSAKAPASAAETSLLPPASGSIGTTFSGGYAPFGTPSFPPMTTDAAGFDMEFGEFFSGGNGGQSGYGNLSLAGEQSGRHMGMSAGALAQQQPFDLYSAAFSGFSAVSAQQTTQQQQLKQLAAFAQQAQQQAIALQNMRAGQQNRSSATGPGQEPIMGMTMADADLLLESLASLHAAGQSAGAAASTAALRRAATSAGTMNRSVAGMRRPGTSSGASKASAGDAPRPAVVAQSLATNKRFPRDSTKVLKEWLYHNTTNPYPSEAVKVGLMEESGLSLLQLNNWFINARRRLLVKTKAGSSNEKAEFQLRENADAV